MALCDLSRDRVSSALGDEAQAMNEATRAFVEPIFYALALGMPLFGVSWAIAYFADITQLGKKGDDEEE